MTKTSKLAAGSPFPPLAVATVGGGLTDFATIPGWRLLIVYRGRHCPLCKKYLKTLDNLLDDLSNAGITVIAVSADSREKAEADVASEGWRFPVGYDLTIEQMRSLGLYISEPTSQQEADRPFAEPGLFAVNPDGKVQIVDISNAPFSRPDLASVLLGVKFIKEKNYPIRGTMSS